MGLKLKEEQDLGVIVKKEATGIMVTNKGHKTMIGNMGDTLMQRVDRSTYVLTKEEVAERKAAAKPETAAQKKARLAAEAAAKPETAAQKKARLAAEAAAKPEADANAAGTGGGDTGTTAPASLDLGGEGASDTSGNDGAAE